MTCCILQGKEQSQWVILMWKSKTWMAMAEKHTPWKWKLL